MDNERNFNPGTENPANGAVGEQADIQEAFAAGPSREKRCPNCQALLTEDQLFCPECGASFKRFCPNCRTELQENQVFCPSCGQRVEQQVSTETNNSVAQFNANIGKQKSKKKLMLGLIGAAAFLRCCGIPYIFDFLKSTALP